MVNEDFCDDIKDVGELGVGYIIMVFYELVFNYIVVVIDVCSIVCLCYKEFDGEIVKELGFNVFI